MAVVKVDTRTVTRQETVILVAMAPLEAQKLADFLNTSTLPGMLKLRDQILEALGAVSENPPA